MKTKHMIMLGVGAAVIGGIYWAMQPGKVDFAKLNGTVPKGISPQALTQDAAGNYWFGGAIVWKAPKQSWTI